MTKKFLITGANGQLAREFISYFQKRRIDHAAPPEGQLDITDPEQIRKAVEQYRPNVLLNCAAYNQVDMAEEKPDLAYRINSEAVVHLAGACKKSGVFLIHFGTDYVFDGTKGGAYTEDDAVNPLNVYGKSKLSGEDGLRAAGGDFLILRLSWVFGEGQQNFLFKLAQWAKNSKTLEIVEDEISVPTFTQDVVDVALKALEHGLRGTYHLTNSGHCSRYEWAKYYFKKINSDVKVVPVSSQRFVSKVKRPLRTNMSNKKISDELGLVISTWQSAVDRFIERNHIATV